MTEPDVTGEPGKTQEIQLVGAGSRRHRTGGSGRNGDSGLLAPQNALAAGIQGYSYQVCLNCGAMRLFDEKAFRAYGPVRYDLNALIA